MPMSVSPQPQLSGADNTTTLSSFAAAEILTFKFRFGIYIVFALYFVFFRIYLGSVAWDSIIPLIVTGNIWFLWSLFFYLAAQQKRYRRWMPWASAMTDVMFVAMLNLLAVKLSPLSYCGNLVVSLYFISIGIVAIRKNVRFVYAAGLLAACLYLVISLYFQWKHQSSIYALLYFDGKNVASVAFLDQLAKSISMAVTAWLVGSVTKKIRSAQNKYQTLFDNVPDGIVLTSHGGAVETVNQSFLDMIQEPLSNVIGKPVNTFFASTLKTSPMDSVVTQRTSSTEIPVAIADASIWSRANRTQKILSIRNLSVQEELKNQISQAQKTEALGQIARGLAHDFNNLLGGILGAVSLIQVNVNRSETTPEKNKIKTHAQLIQDCAKNARDIIKRLLALSRPSEEQNNYFELRSTLNELRDFTQKTFGDLYTVSVHTKLTASATIAGNENTIFQALLNICLNAKESMPNGGPIAITLTETTSSTAIQMSSFGRNRGIRHVRVRISDNGCGMSPTLQQRCLEPFFSTKETSRRGTGLGLSISHNIIRHHNGFLEISSTENQGTHIDVFLPCYPKDSRLQ